MKKALIIFVTLIAITGAIVFLRIEYIEQQRAEARMIVDQAFNLFDTTKDAIDSVKDSLEPGKVAEINKSADLLKQSGDVYDQAEKAFTRESYTEAMRLARQSIDLGTEFKEKFDSSLKGTSETTPNKQQVSEARAAIDSAFNLLDRTKDAIDEIKLKGIATEKTMAEISTFSNLFSEAQEKYDASERKYTEKKYDEAIILANESIRLMNAFKDKIDNLRMPR